MALIKCSDCGKLISERAKKCPKCGKKNKAKISFNLSKKNINTIILTIVIATLILFTGYFKFYKQDLEFVKDSVVMIEIYNDNNNLISTGSGFCAYETNYIVTNFHVIEGAYSIKVITDEKKEYKVNDIVIFNKKEDLAIISINGKLKKLRLGNGNKIKLKDKVTAIGSPMGEQNTVSEGIISKVDEKNMIGITTPISHGSSGGVLLNKKNEVIGITSAGYDDAQNLNFAININVLNLMYSNYKNNKYDVLNNNNYKDCVPNIVNHNTSNELSIKNKCSFSSYNNYSTNSLNLFYLATNAYQIFNTAMYKIGINGLNINYKKLTELEKKEAANNFTYLSKYEMCEEHYCDLSNNISSWSMEQFILELDLMTRYELAILMVEIDKYLYSNNELVDYLNNTNLDYEDKIILNRLFNKNDNRYNREIIEIFNNDTRINHSQEVDLLKYLGMTVDSNGIVYW